MNIYLRIMILALMGVVAVQAGDQIDDYATYYARTLRPRMQKIDARAQMLRSINEHPDVYNYLKRDVDAIRDARTQVRAINREIDQLEAAKPAKPAKSWFSSSNKEDDRIRDLVGKRFAIKNEQSALSRRISGAYDSPEAATKYKQVPRTWYPFLDKQWYRRLESEQPLQDIRGNLERKVRANSWSSIYNNFTAPFYNWYRKK